MERSARITAQREEEERIAKKNAKRAAAQKATTTKKLNKAKAKATRASANWRSKAKEVSFIENPVL